MKKLGKSMVQVNKADGKPQFKLLPIWENENGLFIRLKDEYIKIIDCQGDYSVNL